MGGHYIWYSDKPSILPLHQVLAVPNYYSAQR